jgi:2-iminoacetate synthase
MKKYNPVEEYNVDLARPEVAEKIIAAKRLFKEFAAEFWDVSLADESSVESAYDAAKQMGIFDTAAGIRELVFGKDTTTYGVSYISDLCVSGCTYCPIRRDSKDAESGKPIKRKTLTLEQFVEDTKEIIKDGHSHICFLAGDGAMTAVHPEKLVPYLQELDKMDGIDEIILNVTPQTSEIFGMWRSAVKNKSLQFRVFQETYDKGVYAKKHLFGPKADYQFRKGSQSRAMDAGFDNYGLGVLLGLNPMMVQEIDDLVQHADELTDEYGKAPARVCLPTANTLAGVNNVEKQHHVSAKANELAYALAKLGMPETSIVSSERDTPEMLRILDRYASNRTVDVQPSVGGNLEQKEQASILAGPNACNTQLKQTTVFPTSPDATKADYAARGYNLVFKY